jgi:hypothetical protein
VKEQIVGVWLDHLDPDHPKTARLREPPERTSVVHSVHRGERIGVRRACWPTMMPSSSLPKPHVKSVWGDLAGKGDVVIAVRGLKDEMSTRADHTSNSPKNVEWLTEMFEDISGEDEIERARPEGQVGEVGHDSAVDTPVSTNSWIDVHAHDAGHVLCILMVVPVTRTGSGVQDHSTRGQMATDHRIEGGVVARAPVGASRILGRQCRPLPESSTQPASPTQEGQALRIRSFGI